MTRYVGFVIALLCLMATAWAQPEFYADPYLGLPEFRILPIRLPTADPDSVNVEIHVRIVYDDLQFVKKDDMYEANYDLDATLTTGKDQLVSNRHLERTVTVNTFEKTNSRQSGDQTRVSFTVPPDRYRLRVSLTDRESRKERVLERELYFPADEWSQDFRLGDLILLDSTGAAQMGTGLLSGEPLRFASRLFASAKEGVSAEYQVWDEKERIVLSGGMDLTGGGPLYADTLALSTQSLPNGSYRLIVTARLSDKVLARYYPFKILWQNLPDYIQDLDLAIRQLKYIASDQEMDRLLSAPPSKREELFQDFWKKRDPTPSTPVNERMEEYYRRVKYANEHFSGFRDGWETDMGRVYIIFGPPTDVERHPFDIDSKPYEYWFYYDINRRFLFVDEDGFGEYRLKSPLWHNEY